jgi:hypothetical protein
MAAADKDARIFDHRPASSCGSAIQKANCSETIQGAAFDSTSGLTPSTDLVIGRPRGTTIRGAHPMP